MYQKPKEVKQSLSKKSLKSEDNLSSIGQLNIDLIII